MNRFQTIEVTHLAESRLDYPELDFPYLPFSQSESTGCGPQLRTGYQIKEQQTVCVYKTFQILRFFFYITVNPMWCHSNFWCPRGSFLPIISGNLPEIVCFFAGLSNFYMVKYCEIFKMASSKILVFQHRLKTRSQAPES